MESIAELKTICSRENEEDNKKTMILASRVSIYFTRLFLLLNLSANHVTYLFIAAGTLGAAAFLGPGVRWAVAGYILQRLHVIIDVCDGEVARYRRTFSAAGAYLDFITHYFVYSLMFASITFRYFLDIGRVWMIAVGFLLVISLVLNRAACDCWFRANFGKESRHSIEEGHKGQERSSLPSWRKAVILTAAHTTSAQTFLNAYIAVMAMERFVDLDLRAYLITIYTVILFSFSILRIILTIVRGKIPRRATYY